MSITKANNIPKTHNRNKGTFKRMCEEYSPCETRKMTDTEIQKYNKKEKNKHV